MAWYSGSWNYRIGISAQAAQIAASETDFLCYFPLSAMPASFWANVKSDGGDIRVTESDGDTQLPLHLVGFDSVEETGGLFFKADIDSGGTTYYVYYGNSGASAAAVGDTYGRNNVYTGFRWVYHLNESPGVGAYVDATGNEIAGDEYGSLSTTSGKMDFPATLMDGSTTDGIRFSGFDADTLDIQFPLTLLAWVDITSNADFGAIASRFSSLGSGNRCWSWMLRRAASGSVIWFYKYDNSNGLDNYISSAPYTFSPGTYQHFAVSVDSAGTSAQHYQNGATLGSAGTLNDNQIIEASSSATPWIGAQHRSTTSPDDPLQGAIQNLMQANTSWSADRIATYYNQTNDPGTFWSVGSQETDGGAEYTLTADSQEVPISAQGAELHVQYVLLCSPGEVTISGQDASTSLEYTLTCDSGIVLLSGDAALLVSRIIAVDASGIALVGQDATIAASMALVADFATVAIAPQSVLFGMTITLSAAPGTIAIAGQDVIISTPSSYDAPDLLLTSAVTILLSRGSAVTAGISLPSPTDRAIGEMSSIDISIAEASAVQSAISRKSLVSKNTAI